MINTFYLFHERGLIRCDTDLKVNHSGTTATRRRCFLSDTSLVVVRGGGGNSKVLHRISLSDYNLYLDKDQDHNHSNFNNNNPSVFTFWSSKWPHKFILQHKTSNGDSYTFSAPRKDICNLWVSAIKSHQEKLVPDLKNTGDYNLQLKTFSSPPVFCDVTGLAISGKFLQGYEVINKLTKAFENIIDVKLETVKQYLDQKSRGYNFPSKNLNRMPTNPRRNKNFATANGLLPADPRSIPNRHSIDVTPQALDNSQIYKVVVGKPRVDDQDWYIPEATRKNWDHYLRPNLWRNGAFLVRSGSATNYCLTVIYDAERNFDIKSKDRSCVKHIQIKEYRARPEAEVMYHLNNPEETEGKFKHVNQLIEYFLHHNLNQTFENLDTTLVDVLSEREIEQEANNNVRPYEQPKEVIQISHLNVRDPEIPRREHRQSGPARSGIGNFQRQRDVNRSNTFQMGQNTPVVRQTFRASPEVPIHRGGQNFWSVRHIPRRGGNRYEVIGYARGRFTWNADENNQCKFIRSIDLNFVSLQTSQSDMKVTDFSDFFKKSLTRLTLSRVFSEGKVRKNKITDFGDLNQQSQKLRFHRP